MAGAGTRHGRRRHGWHVRSGVEPWVACPAVLWAVWLEQVGPWAECPAVPWAVWADFAALPWAEQWADTLAVAWVEVPWAADSGAFPWAADSAADLAVGSAAGSVEEALAAADSVAVTAAEAGAEAIAERGLVSRFAQRDRIVPAAPPLPYQTG